MEITMKKLMLIFIVLTAGLSFNSHAESPTFKKKQVAAREQIDARFKVEGWPQDPTKVLSLIEEAETKRIPAFQGYDHNFHLLARQLAEYSRKKAQESSLKDQGVWYFAAGEAQFAYSKTGAEDYQNFLSVHTLPEDDSRLVTAKKRLQEIEELDKGLSR